MTQPCNRCDQDNPNRDVVWSKATPPSQWPSEGYGPDADGFCMVVGHTDPGGDSIYENINFCPWCGRKLEQA